MSKSKENDPLSLRNIIAGIIITVVGGIILTYILKKPEPPKEACPKPSVIVGEIPVSIDAEIYWYDTSIQVQKGDCLEFTATGSWWNGISNTESNGDEGLIFGLGRPACGGCPVTDGNLGELVGKIGNSPPFRIGKTTIRTINQDGFLLLAMNENTGYCIDEREGSCYDDNNGFVDVKVTIHRIE